VLLGCGPNGVGRWRRVFSGGPARIVTCADNAASTNSVFIRPNRSRCSMSVVVRDRAAELPGGPVVTRAGQRGASASAGLCRR
jgi:hypothetical protein